MRNQPVTITCEHCGKQSKMHAYRLKKGTGKFCNQACYLAHRWGDSGKCKTCGSECQTKFCGPECQKNYWNINGYREHKRERNWVRKLALIDALGGKCTSCGFSDHRALDINHIDPTRKMRPKDGHYIWSRRFKDWEANRDNIELLCANCHRLHTWEQRGFGPLSGRLDK